MLKLMSVAKKKASTRIWLKTNQPNVEEWVEVMETQQRNTREEVDFLL